MDVRPVGSGPTGTDVTQGVGAANPAPKVSVATGAGGGGTAPALDAAILSALSEPDLGRLMNILEPQHANQTSEFQKQHAWPLLNRERRSIVWVFQNAAVESRRESSLCELSRNKNLRKNFLPY